MKLLLNRLIQRGVWSFYSEADIDALVADAYIPVATHAELNQVRTAAAATFGAGTKWAGSYTGGLDKKYIQVRDIDLTAATRAGGAYDNGGLGWAPIGTFTGTYDGGGKVIEGMFINRPTTNQQGLFNTIDSSAILRNVNISNCDVTGQIGVGALVAYALNSNISNCVSSGSVTGTERIGGIIGFDIGNLVVINVFSSASITSTLGLRAGGIVGRSTNTSTLDNSCSVGSVSGSAATIGGLVGAAGIVVTNSYYDTTTSGQSDTGKGTPLTTAEMYALTAASTGWSVNDWIFGWGLRYPRLRAFKNTEI